jgi:type I restriction enzyme R subunit
LGDEEQAFYDAIAGLTEQEVYDMPFLCDLVREVMQSVKRNLNVDWTKPHRENVKAGVESAVKSVLRRKRIKGEQFAFILNRIMQQAEEMYEEWPLAAEATW